MIKFVRVLVTLILAIIAVAILVNALSRVPMDGLDINALAQRAERARVTWADYGEDIKAELGATPAALWHGVPESARLEDGRIEVKFSLSGAWNSFEFGMPILLRDPEGKVLSPDEYRKGGGYTFTHTAPVTPLSVPWIELKFPPNNEARIAFDANGEWRAQAR